MVQGALDHQSAGDPLWQEAERRERVIRPLAGRSWLTASEVADAATALGLGRSRIYEMVALYRATPLTSALIPPKPGPRRGARLLAPEAEAVIEQGIRGYYMTRQKPTVAGLRRYMGQKAHPCGKAR
jgi:putative transposase